MSIRVIGAVLIILGTTYLGVKIAAYQNSTICMLEELCGILDYLACELEYRRLPLPELCRSVAGNKKSQIFDFFQRIAEEMDAQICPSVAACTESVLLQKDSLPDTVSILLRRLGNLLGRFDVEGEIVGLHSLRQECENVLEHLRLQKAQKGKSNQTLWICAGVMAAVLMM